MKEKPRRGKQGKKFKEEETWEQLAEISKEYITIIGQELVKSWKKRGHSRGSQNFVRTYKTLSYSNRPLTTHHGEQER